MNNIKSREAEIKDEELILSWRNNPNIYKFFKNPNPVTKEEHSDWFYKVLNNDDIILIIFEIDDKPCGQVRFDIKGDVAEVGINVAPNYQGQGLGAMLLSLGEKELLKKRIVKKLIAIIINGNLPSEKIFTKNNFHKTAEQYYEKRL